MKKVIRGEELREKMSYAINLICDTVKSTLGPKGSNVIIDHSAFTPFITNDGVTIAENIESEDAVINTILELTKEASINTNNLVGDGTTTTLVLLQQIFNMGLVEIQNGKNPITLKKELEADLDLIIKEIEKESKTPTKEDLKNIAITSANSKEIGTIIGDAFTKVLDKSAISIKENTTAKTEIIYKKGYSFDTILSSPYFLLDTSKIELTQPLILLVNSYIQDIEDLSLYINYAQKEKRPLIVLADDYEETLTNYILSINNETSASIYLFKIPEYGKNKHDIIKDIEIISCAKVKKTRPNLDILGEVSSIKITEEETSLFFKPTAEVCERIEVLKNNLKQNPRNDFIKRRISMLEKGLIDIKVGGQTTTERREKKMRYDDALCAIQQASHGVLIGSGLSLIKILDKINPKEFHTDILKNTLQEPFNQIMQNSALDNENILTKIKNNNYQILYNVATNSYEDINSTTILDSTEVVKNSLKNATSIATLLLTTTSLIINEYQNNIHKVNDYSDL